MNIEAILIGCVTGFLSAFFGIGGSSVDTPVIRTFLGLPPLQALATPLPLTLLTAGVLFFIGVDFIVKDITERRFPVSIRERPVHPAAWLVLLAAGMIGLLSGVLANGGGIFFVPAFVILFRMPVKRDRHFTAGGRTGGPSRQRHPAGPGSCRSGNHGPDGRRDRAHGLCGRAAGHQGALADVVIAVRACHVWIRGIFFHQSDDSILGRLCRFCCNSAP